MILNTKLLNIEEIIVLFQLKNYCFFKCINFSTGEDYKQQYLDFIKSEKRRSINMAMARIKSCLKSLGIQLGYYNRKEIYPRTICKKDEGLFLYNIHFCLIWKSEGIAFNIAIDELKATFIIVDNFIIEENVIPYSKYDFSPKKLKFI